jgi:lysophospholipase L1-like esterase
VWPVDWILEGGTLKLLGWSASTASGASIRGRRSAVKILNELAPSGTGTAQIAQRPRNRSVLPAILSAAKGSSMNRLRQVCFLGTWILAATWLPLRAASAAPQILLYGDSLCSPSSNFSTAMQEAFPQTEVVPAGIVGATTWAMAERWAQADALISGEWTGRPDLIVVLMGVNNFGWDHSHDPEWGWADLESIRRKAQARHAPILIGTPLTYGRTYGPDKKPCPPKWSASYVSQVRKLLLQLSQPDVIDFNEAIPLDEADTLLPDCLHPSPDGGRRMAAQVHRIVCQERYRPEFARVCGRPTEVLKPPQ